jgi:HlyD family secretion protein
MENSGGVFMDITRDNPSRKKWLRRGMLTVAALTVVGAIAYYVSGLKQAPPSVERATLWTDTVKRGPLVIQVRGTGTLVPENIQWITTANEGRVERVLARAGKTVKADMVLLELSNPERVQAAMDALWQLKAAEAEYQSLSAQLENQLLAQSSAVAAVKSEQTQSKLRAEMNESLGHDGLIAEMDVKFSRIKADELTTRLDMEQQRLAKFAESVKVQLVAQRARVEQLKALYQLRREQVEALRIRAGIDGVLQELPVEVGQRVMPGANLAKVAQPEPLKAELKIPETLAKDVQHGQRVSVDTRTALITGRVSRIDPAVREGTVKVDVALDKPLPAGARPDLSVDGSIELERLDDVLSVGRPAMAQARSTMGLFKLTSDGRGAVRMTVRLGRCSVSTMEVVAGLQPGDEVILSDMSQWDAFDRIQFK